jgi:hypothetical protein
MLLPPLAFASPPDPSWVAGFYDGADGDDIVSLVYETSAAPAAASPHVGPLPCLLEISLEGIIPRVFGRLFTRGPRAPPILPSSDSAYVFNSLPPPASGTNAPVALLSITTFCLSVVSRLQGKLPGSDPYRASSVLQRSWPGTRRHARSRAADRCCRVQSAVQLLGSGHRLALPHMIENGQVATRQASLFRHTSGACGLTTVTGRQSQASRQSSDNSMGFQHDCRCLTRRQLHPLAGRACPANPLYACTRGVV